MRRRAVAIVISLIGLMVLFISPNAEAATVDALGWWSRTATTDPLAESPAPLPIPAPTTPDTVPIGASVGETQLLVEGAPDGALAIAAATWTLADRESTPSLTLPISPGSTVSPSSVILACKAAAPWTAPSPRPGRWETKPLTDGRSCINGVIADDLSSITFGMQPLLRKQLLDVVFVPGRVAELPPEANGSTFRWVFDQPTADSLTLVEGSDFSEGAGPVVVTIPPAGGQQSTGFTAPPATVAPSGGQSSFTAAPSPSGDSSAAASPALEPQDLGPSVPRLDDQLLASSLSTDGTPRTLGIILLLIGAAIAAWAHFGDAAVDPEAPVMVGLGRFRRELQPDLLAVERVPSPTRPSAPRIS